MEPFYGQIQMFGFNFPPRGWAFCDGALLPISQNQALFSLLGTTYGGDGRTTFGLPDLRGRNAVHVGTGTGIAAVSWGQKKGSNSVTVAEANMPNHNHGVTMRGNTADGDAKDPTGRYPGSSDTIELYADDPAVNMGALVQQNKGGSQPMTVFMPMLGIYHSIALQGIFPSRS